MSQPVVVKTKSKWKRVRHLCNLVVIQPINLDDSCVLRTSMPPVLIDTLLSQLYIVKVFLFRRFCFICRTDFNLITFRNFYESLLHYFSANFFYCSFLLLMLIFSNSREYCSVTFMFVTQHSDYLQLSGSHKSTRDFFIISH